MIDPDTKRSLRELYGDPEAFHDRRTELERELLKLVRRHGYRAVNHGGLWPEPPDGSLMLIKGTATGPSFAHDLRQKANHLTRPERDLLHALAPSIVHHSPRPE